MTTLHATRGANYWSRRPVTRVDILVGAYDEISSYAPTTMSTRVTGRCDQ